MFNKYISMADLTLPIIGLTTMIGYLFSKNGKDDRQTIIGDDKIEEFEKPNGDNIYSSDKANEINNELLQKSFENYKKSMTPSRSGILPPLFNTYGVSGSDILLNSGNNTQINKIQQKDLIDINKLKDITVKNNIKVDARPMFQTNMYEGKERVDNNYFQLGGETDAQISLLTGLPINNEHSNMIPFFGSNTKQNIEPFTNVSVLDKYTGNNDTFKHKKETFQLFENKQQDINGTPIYNVESDRFVPSTFRQNEKLNEDVRVSAPIAGTFTNVIKPIYKNVDELRTSNNKKETYKGRQNSGKFGDVRGLTGKVEKQRPDTFYEKNEGHLFKTKGQFTAPNMRENYDNFKPTNRKEYNSEYYGNANNESISSLQRIRSTDQGNQFDSILESPKRQNYENDYSRNISSIKTTNDFGKESFTLYNNERLTTEDKTHTVNIHKSKFGAITRFEDLPKSTMKETVLTQDNSGNVKTQFNQGISGAYNTGLLDMNAKTTHKETTIIDNYKGNVVKNEGMGYLVNKYTAKTTGKEIITNNSEYSGNINSKDKQSTIRTTFENPEKIRNATHTLDYQGIANSYNNKDLSRFNYSKAVIRDNREISLSGERSTGPQKFQINKGKDSFGEFKVSTNTLLKERNDQRDHLNVNQIQNPTNKNIYGILTKFNPDKSHIDRLEPSLVYTQHNNNPYSLKKVI